jgi:hypothetical protein
MLNSINLGLGRTRRSLPGQVPLCANSGRLSMP